MKKWSCLSFILINAAFLLWFGCGRTVSKVQLRNGIWASGKDLWDEAVFRWKKVLADDPQSVAAHNNLAVAYEKKGLWDEARKEYEVALKIDPNNTYAQYNYDHFLANIDARKKDEKKNEPPAEGKKEHGKS